MTATATKKTTVATVKAFIKKRLAAGDLLVNVASRFDGMYDCVMNTGNTGYAPATFTTPCKNDLGVKGVWFVYGGDRCTPFDDGTYYGYRVWNCCGSWSVAAKK